MPSFDVVLCDILPNLVREWRRVFAAHPDVEIQCGDLLEVEADAYVSPANSLGIMDGGIDAALSARFPRVDARVQAAIRATHSTPCELYSRQWSSSI